MHWKKLLALLLAAALALSVLAGCGGGQSAARALLDLLDGKYANVSVEMDPELEADLRQALRAAEAENAGDDEAAVRAALETLVGSTVTFRTLGEGQQGDAAFDLVFHAGADPDAAAQTAYAAWNIVFADLPADGLYAAGLAMVQTQNGVWMLVKAAVDKAGTVDKDDGENDRPEDDGFVPVSTAEEWKAALSGDSPDTPVKIRLTGDFTLEAGLPASFYGQLDGNGRTITLTGSRTTGLFQTIGDAAHPMGKVENLTVQAAGTIISSDNSNGIAWYNWGEIRSCQVEVTGSITGQGTIGGIVGINQPGGVISGCDVTIAAGGSVAGESSASQIGGIAGVNQGSIRDHCTVTVAGALGRDGDSFVGGIAGVNQGGSIRDCRVEVTGSITGNNTIGGITGSMQDDADSDTSVLSGCTVRLSGSGTISASYGTVGGIAGKLLDNSITDCHVKVAPDAGILTGSSAGGIVGRINGGRSLEDCTVDLEGTIGRETADGLGGIVGWTISSSCTISGCEVTIAGSISGIKYIGGIAGLNGSAITQCTVTLEPTGQLTSANSTGGIAGQSDSMRITDCTVNVNNIGQISNMAEGTGGIAGNVQDACFDGCQVNIGAAFSHSTG